MGIKRRKDVMRYVPMMEDYPTLLVENDIDQDTVMIFLAEVLVYNSGKDGIDCGHADDRLKVIGFQLFGQDYKHDPLETLPFTSLLSWGHIGLKRNKRKDKV